MTERFTPTEDLILEVLAARYRLGHSRWPFDSRHRRTLNSLARRGLLSFESDVTPYTLRATLTEAGIKAATYDGYTTPTTGGAP